MGKFTDVLHPGATASDRIRGRGAFRGAAVAVAVALAVSLAAATLPAGAAEATAGPVASSAGDATEAGTLLVRFRAGASRSATALEVSGARVRREIPGTGFVEVSTAGRPAGVVARELAASGAVAEVEPNRIRRATALPNDPGYAAWQAPYLEGVDLPAAWDLTTGRDDLVVAVVDTGVDLNHPDLAARLVPGIDIVNHDSVPGDDHGHGTMVAGILAAQTNNAAGVAGVTWRGRIMPVKVLDATGAGTDAGVAAGIVWAADHGAKVINLSLGGPGASSVIQAAVDHALAEDAVVVAAAGNDATSEPEWPAAATGVVAVGATTWSDTLASFSNYGSWIDLVAPGVKITSTARGGGYATGSGTSFSSPIVAGVAALARAADPAASAAEVTDRLSRGAKDLGVPGVDATFGAGLLDALATLRLTTSPAPLPTQPAPLPTPPAPPVAPQASTSGYWMLGADGRVYPFGDAKGAGDPSGSLGGVAAADIEPTPTGAGYWVLDQHGAVYSYGDAPSLGGLPPGSLTPGETAISLSATRTGQGYWIFTTTGRAVAFADAAFLGDLRGVALNGAVIGSVATPTGHGYYMVASDGGIFAFGDANFYGSMGNHKLNAPVRALVPDPDGVGYWLVAADGGVFAFDGGFRGSTGNQTLNAPITGMVAYGDGYLMVARDGGIFAFSDKPFAGSLGATPPAHPIVAVATPS
jgi:subtilisin family serine protease